MPREPAATKMTGNAKLSSSHIDRANTALTQPKHIRSSARSSRRTSFSISLGQFLCDQFNMPRTADSLLFDRLDDQLGTQRLHPRWRHGAAIGPFTFLIETDVLNTTVTLPAPFRTLYRQESGFQPFRYAPVVSSCYNLENSYRRDALHRPCSIGSPAPAFQVGQQVLAYTASFISSLTLMRQSYPDSDADIPIGDRRHPSYSSPLQS